VAHFASAAALPGVATRAQAVIIDIGPHFSGSKA
jgi:hypothetical protein